MRPDVCGAIVMFDLLTWLGEGVIVAVATGTDMPQATFQWLKGLAALWQKTYAQQLLRRHKETASELHWERPVSLSVRHQPAASASLFPSAR